MNFNGIIIAAVTFLIIGIFHPLVVKSEYHFSKKMAGFCGSRCSGSAYIVICESRIIQSRVCGTRDNLSLEHT